jgi:hypothetical protein
MLRESANDGCSSISCGDDEQGASKEAPDPDASCHAPAIVPEQLNRGAIGEEKQEQGVVVEGGIGDWVRHAEDIVRDGRKLRVGVR